MITDKIKCPYCKKNMMWYNSKSCDECYRKGKFKGKLSYVQSAERKRSQWEKIIANIDGEN